MKPRRMLAAALLMVGCGGSGTPPVEARHASGPASVSPPSSVASAPRVASAPPAALRRPGHVARAEVVAVLSRGLGDFLARLEVAPVVVAGRFHGWKIVKLRSGDALWQGSELVPGDVVTRVNGGSIERPEQAFSAFQTLAVASELRVDYERSGARRELVYAIDDAH